MRKFEKVSYEQFKKDFLCIFPHYTDERIVQIYKNIQLPERKTKYSAGYDFHSPISFSLESDEDIKIPTGIRCVMEEDDVLIIPPRSSLGFKYYARLANILGVIDADYVFADNEGHIFIKLRNEGEQDMYISTGEAIVQGIFLKYGLTDDDNSIAERVGGIGSTNVK